MSIVYSFEATQSVLLISHFLVVSIMISMDRLTLITVNRLVNLEGVGTVHDESHPGGFWAGLKFCFPKLSLRMEILQGFLDVSSK